MAEAPRVLSDRYEVRSTLGRGGMAQVYRATDRVLGRTVAVKVLSRRFSEDRRFVARFRREAQASAGLNHPHVVSVFDTGSHDGVHYIVMEYVEGETLGAILAREGRLPWTAPPGSPPTWPRPWSRRTGRVWSTGTSSPAT